MAWTTPYVWTTGEVVTAAKLNEQLKDNFRYLKGLDGAVTIGADLTVDNLITSGNVDGEDVSDHVANTTTVHGAVSIATASKFVVRDGSARAKFGAPNASGDALIKGTRVTTAELPAMTDEKIWKGTGASVEEIDVPGAAAKAKLETRNMTAASGDVSYTGYGFQPVALIASAWIFNDGGWGGYTAAMGPVCLFKKGGSTEVSTSENWINLFTTLSVWQRTTAVTLDADGFTVTWEKNGSPAGTANLLIFAFK